jgi:hypothetical protein
MSHEQVYCIRDNWGHMPHLKQWPHKGCVYTVRKILYRSAVQGRGPMAFYHLEEISNPILVERNGEEFEPMFDAAWFRICKHNDISLWAANIKVPV